MANSRKLTAVGAVAVLLAGGVWWGVSYLQHGSSKPAKQQVSKADKPAGPLQKAVRAYNKGNYKDAEAAALKVVESAEGTKDVAKQREAAEARYVMAFAAARQKKMELARDRFADLKEEAAKLPDKGKQDLQPGVLSPTLEEEGAYQHAVCTAALGDKKAAQAEYIKFMQDYPESPLINGAILRMRKLNNGKLPSEAEAAWNKATKIARDRQMERDKKKKVEVSKCGPECLAELLSRNGKKIEVETLAKEMKTTENGTSLLAMSQAAKKHGFSPKGLALTPKGLQKQPVPLITLVIPGHYVVVDKITPEKLTIWDPYGKGIGKPSTRSIPANQFYTLWSGVALVLEPKPL